MTSDQRVPYTLGCTHDTMGMVQRDAKSRDGANLIKTTPSSDRSLQLDSVKLESLVIANQPRGGEYVLGSCTHCPSRPGN